MNAPKDERAWLPPRWFVKVAWFTHRAIYRVTRGRVGLKQPKAVDHWGTARLTTVGRHSGQERSVMIGYFEDGPNLVTLAMNGWSPGEPAWWLNLQAQPVATVSVVGTSYKVMGRAADGDERARLWERWRLIDHKLDAYAARRPAGTAVVVLEPWEANVASESPAEVSTA